MTQNGLPKFANSGHRSPSRRKSYPNELPLKVTPRFSLDKHPIWCLIFDRVTPKITQFITFFGFRVVRGRDYSVSLIEEINDFRKRIFCRFPEIIFKLGIIKIRVDLGCRDLGMPQ